MRPLFRHALASVVASCAVGWSPQPAFADPLAPAPPPAESFDAGTLHVDRYGSGPRTLILIPGLGCGPWEWYGTIARESPHYTIYALTLPGFDGHAAPASAPRPSFAAFDRDVQGLLATRGIERPLIIGHSLGGTLAIYLAEQHPGAYAAIVAVDGLPVFPTLAEATPDKRAAVAAQMGSALEGLDRDALLVRDRRYMQTIGTNDPALVDPAATLLSRSDPQAEAAWLTVDLASDLRPGLSAIGIPFAEIMPYDAAVGAGKMYTLAQTKEFYESLLAGAPHVRVLPIEGAAHFVMLDRPAQFAATLDAFLQSVR